jgi:hypothetical protein
VKPAFLPSRKVGKGPFLLVILVLAVILVFVSYPVQNIFMGGSLTPVRSKPDPPRKGTVGYLHVDEGYGIFASTDLRTMHLWERTVSDPSGLRKAREMIQSGRVVALTPNTSAMSVDPILGTMKILSGPEFGMTLYISLRHVRFMPLHP